MEKKISYLNRNFQDYRESLINFSKEYYPTLTDTFNDASIGSWIIDIMAGVSDNISYLADRVYQETSVNSAQQMSSSFERKSQSHPFFENALRISRIFSSAVFPARSSEIV